jgi:hypothetical protein
MPSTIVRRASLRARLTFAFAAVAVAASAACSGSSSSHPSSIIGATCGSSADCASPLYCYTGSTNQIDGQCTVNCTASATSDSCTPIDPNTACLVAGVCGRSCGNGLTCPDGTTCVSADGLCERSAPFTPGGSSGGGSTSGSASGGSSGGGAPATLTVTGTNSSGTVMMTFSGAATNESMPGVYCKLFSATANPFLEVYGSTASDQSSAEIKLWNFDLGSGTSRTESFSATQNTCAISAMLVTSTSGFGYDMGSDAPGGNCTTTIDTLTDTEVAGSFMCAPLPPDIVGSANPGNLSMTFDCPLQP